jgi:hypothetical protein
MGNGPAALGLALTLTTKQGTVLPEEHFEVIAFLLGEFQENLLAFRVLEAFAVALEEAVRATFAADPDLVRFAIVHTRHQQFVGASRKQPIGRSLEEEEGRPRFELRILIEQLLVPLFESAEMVLFFFSETMKHAPAARVFRDPRRPRVELEAASFRRNRNPKRIAGKQQLT